MSCSTRTTVGMSSAVRPGNAFIVLLRFSSKTIHPVSLILFLNYDFWGQELFFFSLFIGIFLDFNIICHLRFKISISKQQFSTNNDILLLIKVFCLLLYLLLAGFNASELLYTVIH